MMGRRIHRYALVFFLAFGLFSGAIHAQKPFPATSPGCGVLQGVTTCNWPAFRTVLKSAQTIAIEHGQIDRYTGKQLADLARRLGKAVTSPGQPADLTFVIVPDGEHGIDYGPADQPILKLQIFSGASSNGDLLWVEKLRGNPDYPWATSVHAVIDQFEARLAKPQ